MLQDGAKKKRNNTRSIYMTYCLGCKKYTNNMASRSVTMTNKVLRWVINFKTITNKMSG